MGADGNLKLFNLHMEPCLKTHLRIDLLSRLREACRHTAMNRCIVAGDFNFVLEAQDRYKPTLKGFTGQREAEGEYFLQQFKDFLEAQQTEYTRRGGRGANTVLSCLDRIYISIGHWETNDFNIAASINQDFGWPQEDISDHWPVCVRFSKKSINGDTFGYTPIPSWVTKHPCWPRRLEHHVRFFETMFPEIPHATLSVNAEPPECNNFGTTRKIKEAMRAIAAEIKRLSEVRGAQLTSEHLYWGCRTLRAIRDRDMKKMQQGIRAWPKLREAFANEDILRATNETVDKIAEWVRGEALTDIQEQAAEYENIKTLPEYMKSLRRGVLAKWAERWSSYNRKGGIQGALDERGHIIMEDHAACRTMGCHWESVFSAKPSDATAAK